MTDDTCSEKRCDLINQILKGTVDESYYCRTHKRHYYPNKPIDTMTNHTDTDELKQFIRKHTFADFAPGGDGSDVVMVDLEVLADYITADRKRVALEARIDSLLAAKRRIYETDAFELGLALGIIDSELKKLGWTPGELKAQQEEV